MLSERFSKAAARNVFYGGSAVFLVIFVALTAHSHWYILARSTAHAELSESVQQGKLVFERHSCINCHTILGEGAYFAPELGNVWERFGGHESPEGARMAIGGYIRAQPTGAPGRRQMPAFDISDEEMDALVDFFEWVDGIDTKGWPPEISG